jgi:N-acetyltransferase
VNTIDLQPRLVGELVELRPLRPEDWEALFAVAADPLIWTQHPCPDRCKEEVFRDFFRDALESKGALVAVDRKTGKIIGSSRYRWHGGERNELEIGWTFLARSHWGGVYNQEMKRLMLAHAFNFVDRVIFLVGATNTRSRKAMEKIGATLTSCRESTTLHGRIIEHVIYEIRRQTRG